MRGKAPGAGLIPEEGPRSILVVMMSAVGDAVQVLPVLNALKRRYPDTHITWLIQPGPHELVRGHPSVDRFVLFRRRGHGRNPMALLRSARYLRETTQHLRATAETFPGGQFDLVLDLQAYFKAGLLTALAPGRVKVGFDFRRARDLNWLFTTHRIPSPPGRFAHTQDQYLEFLRFLGVDPEPITYRLEPTEEEREAQARFFGPLERRACGVVLATSNPRKDWHGRGYREVVEALVRTFGLQPVLLGKGSPREQEMARQVLEGARAPVLNAMQPSLRRLLWLLEGCALVISPDTGPLHMARALEVPVIGLYGYTNPRRSGPYGRFGDLVVDGYARHSGERYPLNAVRRMGGMDRISPGMVLEKVELAMKKYAGESTER